MDIFLADAPRMAGHLWRYARARDPHLKETP
jgi:hypothetical protein